MSAPAVVSIHDVDPGTLDRVREIVDRVRPRTGDRICLLVVPGLAWTPDQIRQLQRWAAEGLELAGHGWVHYGPPRSLYHRLHGWILSRDQAEHLSRSTAELREMVERGYAWFDTVDLPRPRLYVPPAWALGRLGRRDLRDLPYRWYEVLSGFIDVPSGRLHPTPLVGYEADTPFRKYALRVTNAVGRRMARLQRRPLRIGIHPHDLELFLADDVLGIVAEGWEFLDTEGALSLLAGEVGAIQGGEARGEAPGGPAGAEGTGDGEGRSGAGSPGAAGGGVRTRGGETPPAPGLHRP